MRDQLPDAYPSAEDDKQCDRGQAPSQPGSAGARFPLDDRRRLHLRTYPYAVYAHRPRNIL